MLGWRPGGGRLALCFTVVLALSACGDHDAPTLPEPARGGGGEEVVLTASSGTAAPGSEIVVTLSAGAPDRGGVQGRLVYDADHLRFKGQPVGGPPEEGGGLAFVAPGAHGAGALRILAVDPSGLASPAVALVFEVMDPAYLSGLRFVDGLVVSLDGSSAEIGSVSAVVDPGRTVPTRASIRRLEDWLALLSPRARRDPSGDPEPARVPGAGTRFGDVNLDGVIDVLDVLFLALAAVGSEEIIVGTNAPPVDPLAGNVRPENAPGLGEPSDPCPPGIQVCGTFERRLDVTDVLAVALEAVGEDQAVVGEAVPRANRVGTAVLGDVVGGVRTLSADTTYTLPASVRVEGGGSLVIPAGTRLEAQPGASVVVGRDGTLDVRGTATDPVVLTCPGADPVRGCWDGLVVLGNAPVAGAGPTAVGASGCDEALDEPGYGPYGGCNPDDSRGAVRFLRVEFATRGVQLLGVGRGTLIDHLQVHGSASTGVRLSGGTVDLSRLLVTATAGDPLAWDDRGWEGRAQRLLLQLDPAGGSAGIAGRGGGGPTLYNVSVVGVALGSTSGTAVRLADGASATVANLLALGSPTGLDVDGAASCQALLSGGSSLRSSVFAGYDNLGDPDADGGCVGGASIEEAYLLDPANEITRVTNTLEVARLLKGGLDAFIPDFRPTFDGAAGALPGAVPPADGFFDPTATFVGGAPVAASSSPNIPWYSGWTRGGVEMSDAFGGLRGTVSTLQGEAVADAILLSDLGPIPARSTAEGSYTLELLRPGSGTLRLESLPSGCADPGPVPVVVTPGTETTVDVVLDCPLTQVLDVPSDSAFAALGDSLAFEESFVGELRWGNGSPSGDFEYAIRRPTFQTLAQENFVWGASPDPVAFTFDGATLQSTLRLGPGDPLTPSPDSISADVASLVAEGVDALVLRGRATTASGNAGTLDVVVSVREAGPGSPWIPVFSGTLAADDDAEYAVLLDPRLTNGFTVSGTVDLDAQSPRGSDPAFQISAVRAGR